MCVSGKSKVRGDEPAAQDRRLNVKRKDGGKVRDFLKGMIWKKDEEPPVCFIPSDSHSGFYFPPAASKDRAVHSMEIKDFIILWTYSQ